MNPDTDATFTEGVTPEAEVESFGIYALRFGYSPETVRSYQSWLVRLHKMREEDPGLEEKKFIEDYVAARNLSSPSLIQGRAAMDLYCRFARRPAPQWEGSVNRSPVAARKVCSQDEVGQLLSYLDDQSRIVVHLLYACGLRISEAVSIRLGHLDLDWPCLFVSHGKGSRPRIVAFPASVVPELRTLVSKAREIWHLHSLEPGWAGVAPNGSRAEDDFWLFYGRVRRDQLHPHIHKATIQHAVNRAVQELGLPSGVSCDCLSHSFPRLSNQES